MCRKSRPNAPQPSRHSSGPENIPKRAGEVEKRHERVKHDWCGSPVMQVRKQRPLAVWNARHRRFPTNASLRTPAPTVGQGPCIRKPAVKCSHRDMPNTPVAPTKTRYPTRTTSPSWRKRCTSIHKHPQDSPALFPPARESSKNRRKMLISWCATRVSPRPASSPPCPSRDRPAIVQGTASELERAPNDGRQAPGRCCSCACAGGNSVRGEQEIRASLAPPASPCVLTLTFRTYASPCIECGRFRSDTTRLEIRSKTRFHCV
ncbi:hypothetical protein LXA43DRAFT_360459 [Ganoderma leucocontextum]|nr:hypothetical protein LXA43DRAFT_360459 [Ganoderma leucocontextum]